MRKREHNSGLSEAEPERDDTEITMIPNRDVEICR